jgi:hypothetical protein
MPSRYKLFIIESPSQTELAAGLGEAKFIIEFCRMLALPCEARVCHTKSDFNQTLVEEFVANHSPTEWPLLHISAHGLSNEQGLALTSDDLLWYELEPKLSEANERLEGKLILHLSACFGQSALKMPMMRQQGPYPFLAALYHKGCPTWAKSALGFAVFYFQLCEGRSLDECVYAMRAATNDDGFELTTSFRARNWRDML